MAGDISTCSIRLCEPQDSSDIVTVLGRIGWAEKFVKGQLSSIEAFTANRDYARVYVASTADHVVGFSTVLFEPWNQLGQIHGLVVDPQWRRHRLATRLILGAEAFVQELGGRGIFVDTPINNGGGRRFYEAIGYLHDYTMTEYYDKGLDGVTYVKFFKEVDSER